MSIRSKLSSLREYLTPINNSSNFSTTGEISPEEFVIAGDYLVYKFPTWEWSTAPPKLQKPYLPPDKQILITRHVPSHQRAQAYLGIDVDEEEELEDGWIKSQKVVDPQIVEEHNDIDDLIDETAEIDIEEDDDFEDLSKNNQSNSRKYDLYITYSTSYRVPKVYLVGFNGSGIPLLPDQMFEDISSDYRDKTATIENLPLSYNTTSVSIHPCKHSSVMKVLMQHAKAKLEKEQPEEETEQNEENGIRVDQYLIIFLKFIASVIPGIEYDYTMEVL